MLVPKFVITNKMLMDVGAAEAAREAIDNANLAGGWEAKFREDCLVREVHFSTRMEGNELSMLAVERIIKEDPDMEDAPRAVMVRAGIKADEEEVAEVIDCYRALNYVNQSLNLGESGYGEPMLIRLHELSVEGLTEKGKYRNRQVVIKTGREERIVHRPPNAVEVPYQLKDLFFWLNSRIGMELHPVLKAGILLYELLRIHPFMEANGRVARLMCVLVIRKEGVDRRRFISLAEGFDHSVSLYQKAFTNVEKNGGELTEWLEWFCAAVREEMERIKEKVKRLSVPGGVVSAAPARSVALNERQVKLIEFLENGETMTMPQARQILPEVSDDTLLRDLNDLIKKDLVKKKGKTKGARYLLKNRG